MAILTTHLRESLDDALRRLAFSVHYPVPDEASSRGIRTGIWPAATPLDGDIAAAQLELAGQEVERRQYQEHRVGECFSSGRG